MAFQLFLFVLVYSLFTALRMSLDVHIPPMRDYASRSCTEAFTHWLCRTSHPEKMPMSSMQSR